MARPRWPCGLVAPVVLIAGLIRLPRTLVRQISWELRFIRSRARYLDAAERERFSLEFPLAPFVQVVLALCAAEALRILSQQTRPSPGTLRHPLLRLTNNPGVLGLVLVLLLSAGATLVWRTTGVHAFSIYMDHIGYRCDLGPPRNASGAFADCASVDPCAGDFALITRHLLLHSS